MERLREAAARLESPAYSALRIVAGLMLATHGMQKLFGWFGAQMQPAVGTQLWLGAIIELGTGLLIALGLFTRPAAFLAAGTMAVAYLQFHWKLSFAGQAWVPVVNRGELAALYCFVFLVITGRGAGEFSLSALRARSAELGPRSGAGGTLVAPLARENGHR